MRKKQALPVQVSVVYKTGGKESFDCYQYFDAGAFFRIVSPGTDGKVRTTMISKDQVRTFVVEEYPQQPKPQVIPNWGIYTNPAPSLITSGSTGNYASASASEQAVAYSPKDDPAVRQAMQQPFPPNLKSGRMPDGTPMSQLPDGSVVAAGFML